MVVTLLQWKLASDIKALHKCLILKNLKGKAFLQQVTKTQRGKGMSMADLSAIHAGCILHRRRFPGTHFCERLSGPQGY
jgi:hypothetical protein